MNVVQGGKQMKRAKFKVFDNKTGIMSKPFGFGDLYGYEGEANAVSLSYPFTGVGQDITIACHRGGSPVYLQGEAWNGINPDLIILMCAGVDEKGQDVYAVVQDPKE